MANGPLGGFMPTPPSPGQPPQVKLETSAESRGAFNKFLGTLPSNGAIAPIQTGVVASSTAPVTPMTDNVNIFQPQMSQMTAMPMMPPAQPVQMMQEGGFVDDFGDPGISFDTSDPSIGEPDLSVTESDLAGGTFDDGGGGISFTDDTAGGQDIVTGVGSTTTKPDEERTATGEKIVKTNIRNVGTRGRLRYDPELALRSFAQSTGTEIQELLDRGYGERFGINQPQIDTSVAPANLSTGLKTVTNLTGLNPFVDPTEGIAPVTRTVGTGATTRPNELDLLGLGGLGVDLSSTGRDRLGFEKDRARRAFGVDKNLDPLGITTINQTGKPMSKEESQRIIDSLMSGVNRPKDNTGVQVASLGGLRGQIDRLGTPGLTGTALTSGLPSIDTVADDLVQGRGLGENINNPGNIRAGGGFDGEIGRTRDGFAIFDSMQSGVDAINKLSNTYGSKRNIDTVREFANRYSPVGENTAKEVSGKINFLSNTLGVEPDDKVDFTDPNVQAVFTPALITSEIGRDRAQNVANVLSGFSPSPLNVTTRDLNPNITSNVDQLGAIDTTSQTDAEARDRTLGEALANDFLNARRMPGTAVSDFLNLATTTQNVSPENTAARIARNNRTINQIRADLEREKLSRVPDTALETLEGRRDIEPFALSRVGDDFDQALNIVDARQDRVDQAQRVQDLLDRGARAQQDRDAASLALGVGTPPTTDLTRGPDVSIVGDDERFAELNLRDIVGDTTQERVADILSRPDRFKDTFKIGDVEFPNLIATLANKAGSFFDRRLFDGIVKKGLDAVVDPDTGRIIGAKDEFGNLIEGRDLEGLRDTGESDADPIGTFLKKATEDKEEKDTTPNVFGGGTPRKTLENVSTVVSSPFQARDINFRPVGFDAGNLNKIIERITGVPSPRGMQDGGQVQAVDRFLSKVA